jgi:hypothetical protein
VKLEKLWRGEEISGIGSPISVSPPIPARFNSSPMTYLKLPQIFIESPSESVSGGKRIDVHTGNGRIVIR